MKRFVLALDELQTLVKEIIAQLPRGGVIILEGDLASGKTTLTKAFASYIGEKDVVTSPTFSLQQSYGDRLFHYDLYNKGLEHFLALGLLEELDKEGYHLIEWGDENLRDLLNSAGIETMHIEINKLEDKREYICIY